MKKAYDLTPEHILLCLTPAIWKEVRLSCIMLTLQIVTGLANNNIHYTPVGIFYVVVLWLWPILPTLQQC